MFVCVSVWVSGCLCVCMCVSGALCVCGWGVAGFRRFCTHDRVLFPAACVRDRRV